MRPASRENTQRVRFHALCAGHGEARRDEPQQPFRPGPGQLQFLTRAAMMIEVRNLSKLYGEKIGVLNIDFTVQQRRGRRPSRSQRLRQDDHHEDDDRLHASFLGNGGRGRLRHPGQAQGGHQPDRLPPGSPAAVPRDEGPGIPAFHRCHQGRRQERAQGARRTDHGEGEHLPGAETGSSGISPRATSRGSGLPRP